MRKGVKGGAKLFKIIYIAKQLKEKSAFLLYPNCIILYPLKI